jgi:hypothetical protein
MIPVSTGFPSSSASVSAPISWPTVESFQAAFAQIRIFLHRLAQNIVWGWNVLAYGGAFAASFSIRVAFAGVSLFSPRLARIGSEAALHVRSWWVELRTASEKAALLSENKALKLRVAELERRLQESEAEKSQMTTQQIGDSNNCRGEMLSLKSQLDRANQALNESREECIRLKTGSTTGPTLIRDQTDPFDKFEHRLNQFVSSRRTNQTLLTPPGSPA